MKAQEFIAEGFIPEHFKKRLAKQGYKFLGQGVDQAAFTVPGKPNIVLKIFGHGYSFPDSGDPSHNMFFRWAKFCQKNSNNPFLPKFSGFEKVTIDGEEYIMMYQERLSHSIKIGNAVADLANIADTALYMGDRFNLKNYVDDAMYQDTVDDLESAGVNVKSLFKTLMQLAKIGKSQGYDWDMHKNNVMVRANGQPVIVDPWV